MKFEKRKFLAQPLRWQHKTCAEQLKSIYETLLTKSSVEKLVEEYSVFVKWMGLQTLQEVSLEHTSNRFHRHLSEANLHLKEHRLLPSVSCIDRTEAMASWPINLYLDNIRSAHNVGSIIRTFEAFAFQQLYLSPSTPSPDNEKVKKTAMGADKWVDWIRHHGSISELAKPLIVLETCNNALPIAEFIFPKSFTLVVGNEEYGCSDTALQTADYLITIPMRGRKNSLNVANAFAVVAGEILRQFDSSDKKIREAIKPDSVPPFNRDGQPFL